MWENKLRQDINYKISQKLHKTPAKAQNHKTQNNSLQLLLEQLQSKDLAIYSKITIKNQNEEIVLHKHINIISKKQYEYTPSKITPPPIIKEIPEVFEEIEVYRLGDEYIKERVIMSNLGIDIGTKTIVLSYKDAKGKTGYISEINGYWIFERATPFIENMLNDPNKIRSDGTKRPA